MVTKSIVGRFLILAVLIVAAGVVAQAAMIMTDGGKKPAKTALAAPVPTAQSADPAGDPVRVVYPGPLGDSPAPKPKLTDTASVSPLAAPNPQTTARLAQAMAGGGSPAPQAQPDPKPQPQPQASSAPVAPATPVTPVAASAQPVPAPASDAAAVVDQPKKPAAPQVASAPAPAPAAPAAPARVQVASLDGDVPAADQRAAGGIDINSASVAVLNHLGGGHIGESIAKHRPYRSVEDLVKKRVLRRSVYNQIRNQIAAR